MKNRHHNKVRIAVVGVTLNLLLAIAPAAFAELKEINDAAMSDVVGQTFFRVDSYQETNVNVTRATLAMDVKTELNIKQATFGKMTRLGTDVDADINAANFTLSKLDSGKIEPFVAANPYIELAKEGNRMIGVRLGFEDSQGSLLTSMTSFSGNLGLQVVDDAGKPLPVYMLNDQNGQVESRATQVGVVIIPPPVTQPGNLPVQPTTSVTGDPAFGQDPQLAADVAPPPVPELAPELITNRISNFETFDIGGQSGPSGKMAKDFFISMQSKEMLWKSFAGGDAIKAAPGVHLNIPQSAPITLDQFKAGIPRADIGMTRGSGLF